MGQQQLLLIVLGVIIVGVAIVAGIGLFNVGAEEAAKDEVVAQCVAIGANAQQYFKKPVAMGGGGSTFTGYVIPQRMTATANAGVIDANGIPTTPGYSAAVTPTQVVITGDPTDGAYAWTVTCTVTSTNITTLVND